MATVATRRWTRAEYDRLIELGVLGEDERIQLVGGEIIQLAAHRPSHAIAVGQGQYVLMQVFGPSYWVRVQLPLAIDPDSEPEPNLAVVAGSPFEASESHPSSALLAIEVADTTLRFDRTVKSSVYASAGIADYWIVNLVDRSLEVHRDPVPDASARFGHRYANVTVHHSGEHVAPLARPEARIAVANLLPPETSSRRRSR